VSTRAQQQLLIAQFARRCRLPVSTLRYYDRIGLLRPAVVDPHSGYRRYYPDQLPTAITVAGLRAIGTGPEDIARILGGGAQAEAALVEQRRRITAEIDDRRQALTRLDDLAAVPLPGAAARPRVVELAATQVAAVAFTARFVDLASAITRGVATLRARLRRHDLQPTGWGALLPLDLGEQVSGHVFARIRTDAPASPALATVPLPHGPAVRVTHQGSYDELALAYDAALTDVEHRRCEPIGPVIEDYPTVEARSPDHGRVDITVPVSL